MPLVRAPFGAPNATPLRTPLVEVVMGRAGGSTVRRPLPHVGDAAHLAMPRIRTAKEAVPQRLARRLLVQVGVKARTAPVNREVVRLVSPPTLMAHLTRVTVAVETGASPLVSQSHTGGIPTILGDVRLALVGVLGTSVVTETAEATQATPFLLPLNRVEGAPVTVVGRVLESPDVTTVVQTSGEARLL